MRRRRVTKARFFVAQKKKAKAESFGRETVRPGATGTGTAQSNPSDWGAARGAGGARAVPHRGAARQRQSPRITRNVTRRSARRVPRLAPRPRASASRPLRWFRDASVPSVFVLSGMFRVSGDDKGTDARVSGMRARGFSRRAYQLMRAVETSDADVHDACLRRRRVERHGRLERHPPALQTPVRSWDPGDFGAHRERAPGRVPARAAHHARGEPHRGAQTVRR